MLSERRSWGDVHVHVYAQGASNSSAVGRGILKVQRRKIVGLASRTFRPWKYAGFDHVRPSIFILRIGSRVFDARHSACRSAQGAR
jgi:hypothetical protein